MVSSLGGGNTASLDLEGVTVKNGLAVGIPARGGNDAIGLPRFRFVWLVCGHGAVCQARKANGTAAASCTLAPTARVKATDGVEQKRPRFIPETANRAPSA